MVTSEAYASVIKKLPLGICVLDSDFTILHLNDFFTARLDLKDEAIGQNILELFPEQAAFLKKKLTSAIVLKNSSFSYWEHRPHIFKFNSSRPITGEETLMFQNLEVVPLDVEQGEVKTLCLILQDVTEQASYLQTQKNLAAQLEAQYEEQANLLTQLKTTQSQLLNAEKMASIGQLAAGIAHEINNPLGFIHSNLQSLHEYASRLIKALDFSDKLLNKCSDKTLLILKEDYFKRAQINYLKEDTPALLEESLEGISRVSRIIQNLKIFSHVDNTSWQACDLKQIVDSTLSMLSNELKYKINLHLNYNVPSAVIQCQPVQLNQVLLNILHNSVQSIIEKGDIWIDISKHKETFVLIIKDNGCGIPADILPRVFEPFFTTKDIGKGTGLGLSMAYSVVTQHQGTIELQSESGVGTTLTISFPEKVSSVHLQNVQINEQEEL